MGPIRFQLVPDDPQLLGSKSFEIVRWIHSIIWSFCLDRRINESNVESAKFPASNRPTGLASRKQPSAHHPGADMNIIMQMGQQCNSAPTWPVGNGEIRQLCVYRRKEMKLYHHPPWCCVSLHHSRTMMDVIPSHFSKLLNPWIWIQLKMSKESHIY